MQCEGNVQTIGILAGSGQFPFLVAQGARAKGYKVVACGFTNNTDPALAEQVDAFIILPLGKLNSQISFFKQHGVTQACMAGAINKPRALDVKPDMRAARLLFRIARTKGDDAILRAVAAELQGEGIELIGAETLAPSLRSPEGVLTRGAISQETWDDMRHGYAAAKHFGHMDVGQCIIVKSGIVVAVEAIEGTDATVTRAGELAGAGCTMVKIAKPGQDTRLDLPSIGAGTVALLVKYGFRALAYEAGKTLFFDQAEGIRLAEKHGIALVGVPEDAEGFFEGQKG